MGATTSWSSPTGLDCYPHGHGFSVPTSLKLAGKVSEPCARLMVPTLSSIHSYQFRPIIAVIGGETFVSKSGFDEIILYMTYMSRK
jgi:hypothetical protein